MNFRDYLNKKEIINKYNILSFEEIYGGLVNKIYKVNTNNNVYIIKVLNHYYTNNINKFELTEKISNLCNDNSINVAHAIKINGKYVNKIDSFYIIVLNYIDGITLDVKDIKKEHIIKVAKMLSQIHNINYNANYQKSIRHPIDWKKFVEISDFKNTIYRELYIDNYKKYNAIFSKVINVKNAKKPKLGICHRDVKSSNVIWKNYDPYLIDFESSRVDDIEIDFIETMLRWTGFPTFNIDFDKISLFVKEYKKYINISNINYEETLYANLLGRFDFLYYNLDITLVNKTNDIEEYNIASKEVINMINEINYYLDNIDELAKFLQSLNN